MDEFNKLPTDPAWIKKVEEVGAQAAQELKCMVVLIAVQENGKLAVQVDGAPKSGPLHEMAQDPPGMLANLSFVCALQDRQLRKNKQ